MSKLTKIFVTKYALSSGPFSVMAETRNEGSMASWKGDGYWNDAHGKDFWLTEEEALADCERRRKAKLATPVDINLPERRGDSHDWDGASPSEAFNTCRSIFGLMFRQQLRAAGFTVYGDE
ncbi:TPA: hypothetical protein SMF29_003707 [Serratia marcescens]|nr:hypothetical protein [Serratia marcescens]